ncbi:MAG: PHP domain-containing protein [Syntrophomonadaceae bacterium]|nr:PHP domain-containing protein [Syntrophomonadaceae bacterium]
MKYDLHTHSYASDGLLSPVGLLDAAVAAGLGGVALTDHDTVEGLAAAQAHCRDAALPIAFIPGIELNTEYKGEEVHILGYYIDYEDAALAQRLSELRALRRRRAEQIVDKLRSLGQDIDMAEVLAVARGEQIGRPHIARVLMAHGAVASVLEAFQRYIGRGRPAYVPRYEFAPSEAVAMIKKAGGLPVLAHPGLIRRQELLDEIIALGVEGLECHYPQHSEKQTLKYRETARRYGLLVTGGSDFHGAGSGNMRETLGLSTIDEAEMKNIENRLAKRRKI